MDRAGFACGLSPGFAHGGFLSGSHVVIFLCVCALISSSSKNTIGLGTILMTSIYLNYVFKGLSSKYSHVLKHWGQNSNSGTWGNAFQPVNRWVWTALMGGAHALN